MTKQRKYLEQGFSKELQTLLGMAYTHVRRCSYEKRGKITDEVYKNAWENIWDIVVRAYGLGVDEATVKYKDMFKEENNKKDTRPPLVDGEYSYDDVIDD